MRASKASRQLPGARPRTALIALIALIALTASLVAGGVAEPALAQTPPEIETARRLQDEGAYAAAADALRPYLQASPDDLGTRWLFGRLLHWSGALWEARDAYEGVVAGLPGDPWAKLEYAQVLTDVGDWGKARSVLLRVADDGPPEAALRAREQLAVIRSYTRPWSRITLEILDDNQPYRRYRGSVEAGVHLAPLWTLAVGGDPRILDRGEVALEAGAPRTESASDAWAQLRGYLPGLRLHLTARGGGTIQGEDGSWTGAADLAFQLPRQLTLTLAGDRSRYLWTLASADSLVMMNTVELRLDRADAPGWAAEGAVRSSSFADDNRVTTAFAWVLGPLLRRRLSLRLGYGFSWSDAAETRWTAVEPYTVAVPEPGSVPPFTLEARYTPYFTPESETVHSALAEIATRMGTANLRLNGSLGFHAREQAPVILVTGLEPEPPPGGQLELDPPYLYQRSFTPWRVTLATTLPLTGGLELTGAAEAWETAYYEVQQLSLGLMYRFGFRGSRP